MFGRDERAEKEKGRSRYAARARRSKTVTGGVRTRLRVGVLPFLSTRGEGGRKSCILPEPEIAAALARFRWFDVIAPVTLMRGLSGVRERGSASFQDLDYVVDGALSGNGKHIRSACGCSISRAMRRRCGATVSNSNRRTAQGRRDDDGEDRRPYRSGDPVHRRAAEAARKSAPPACCCARSR